MLAALTLSQNPVFEKASKKYAMTAPDQSRPEPHIGVRNLTMAYGSFVLMRDLTFTVDRGDVFAIMGGSGCGKSTLMRILVGLKAPAAGTVHYQDANFWEIGPLQREEMMHSFGVLYQSGALWSSMTLAENVALPLELYTTLGEKAVAELVSLKLALVGLAGFEDYYPSEISGGMRKRAGIARAMALDPDILFLDEPSAGLDPVSAKMLDDLILEINAGIGTTVVLVTHELPSIFTIASNSVFLDNQTRRAGATGNPQHLLETSENPAVIKFLTRSERDTGQTKE